MALRQDVDLFYVTYSAYRMVCELDLLLFELIEARYLLKYFTDYSSDTLHGRNSV